MSTLIPDQGYPRAAAVSPRLQVAQSTGSTNDDVVAHASADPANWPHLSVLLTQDQRKGRGRMGREWIGPPGTSLAVSVLLRVPAIPVAVRGWVPLAAGVALAYAIENQLAGSSHVVGLKWPNDILIDGEKIAGILTETVPGHPDAVVVGSGINTRMSVPPVPGATSFLLLGQKSDDDQLLADYLSALDDSLNTLIQASGDVQNSGLHASVSSYCLTLGREVRVALPGGRNVVGEAARLDADGRLVLQTANGETAVAAGDVLHLR